MRRKDPFADVQPAEYALPEGVPALQEDPVRTRRVFMAMGLGGMLLGGGIGWVARGWSAAPTPSRRVQDPQLQKEIEWARVTARAPIEELIAERVGFLPTLKYCTSDDSAWLGLDRLIDVALRGQHKEAEVLRQRILEAAPRFTPPRSTSEGIARLRALRR